MKHFILILVMLFGAIVISNAQEKSEQKSKWTVAQTVQLTEKTVIHDGVTKSGNPKYWIEIPEVGKVTVSNGSAVKFKEGTVKLELVKWVDPDGNVKYSVRQCGKTKTKTKNVNLEDLVL